MLKFSKYYPQNPIQQLNSKCYQEGLISAYNQTMKRFITVLGIETSCDDTGCAIVDDKGHVLGENLHSQQEFHLELGGIVPPIARDLHKEAIQSVVEKTLKGANMRLSDVTAIATTIKPGLPLSLLIGMQYGKYLAKISKKPFIPIHHMEAHALTIRMVEKVDFPFLVLLISGGHSLLAVAQSISHFQLLGQSLDDAPGEALDKSARRLKMRNISEFRSMSGGQAVELAAARGDPTAYNFTIPLLQYRNCNFSFSAYKNILHRLLIKEEEKYEVKGGRTLPHSVLYDICACLQHGIANHICHRLQRAMEYVKLKNLIPPDKQTLVVSGGVACNKYIQRALGIVCEEMDFDLRVPPPQLCTDNGIMIAWNGMERLLTGQGIYQHDNLDCLDIQSKCPLGEDLSQDVRDSNIKCKYIKLTKLISEKNLETPTVEHSINT